MKTLYIQCNMGAAGDMLAAALLEICPQLEEFIAQINQIGLPDIRVSRETVQKCGITGTQYHVLINGEEEISDAAHDHHHAHAEHKDHHHHDHDHLHEGHHHAHTHTAHVHHEHNTMAHITQLIDSLKISETVKRDACAVYALIAAAESKAHNVTVEQVHFHEVGAMDAVADIVSVCLLMEKIAPARIIVSPIHVGSGTVKCAHGILPVPAPATAHLLEGIPMYTGNVQGELCTPTGAALLKYFGAQFGAMPTMTVTAIGYGCGKKDFETANCVRVFLGEVTEEILPVGMIAKLSCNLDDMTGEALGYAQEQLFAAGALDVYITPIQMKKSRPGHLLACVCSPEKADALAAVILRHTTTLGVRKCLMERYTLTREARCVETPYGTVHVKTAEGFGVKKSKPEYEDIARLAREHAVPLSEIIASIPQK